MNETENMPQQDSDSRSALGENSTIRVGLGLIIASYIALSSWWASAINSKLSVVLAGQQAVAGDFTTLRAKVETLERSAEQFQQFGSPVLRARIEVLEKGFDRLNAIGCPASADLRKRVEQMEKDLEVHKLNGVK